MFVVRRPFRDAEGMIEAGSIVEPANIVRFHHRLLEGHIVEVTEHNFDEMESFFRDRYGMELKKPVEKAKVVVEAKATAKATAVAK